MRKDIMYTSLLNSEEDITDLDEDLEPYKSSEYVSYSSWAVRSLRTIQIPEKPSILVIAVSIVSIALTYIGCFVYLAFFNVVDPVTR